MLIRDNTDFVNRIASYSLTGAVLSLPSPPSPPHTNKIALVNTVISAAAEL